MNKNKNKKARDQPVLMFNRKTIRQQAKEVVR